MVKNKLINFLIFIGSLTLCVFISELFFRAIGKKPIMRRDSFRDSSILCEYDSLEEAYKAGKIKNKIVGNRFEYHSKYGWTNPGGFSNADKFYSENIDKDRYLFLGDSFTMGASADKGKGYVDVFSKLGKSNNIVTFNTGTGGYGQNNQLMVLEDYIAKIKPNVVILGFYTGNDFTDNLHPPDRFFRTDLQAYKRYENYIDEFGVLTIRKKSNKNIWSSVISTECSKKSPKSMIKKIAFTTSFGSSLYAAYRINFRNNLDIHKLESISKVTSDLLNQIRNISEINGAKFVVFIIPNPPSGFYYDKPIPKSKEYLLSLKMLKSLKISYVDPFDSIKGSNYPIRDDHWNNEGHRIGGEYLYKMILKSNNY